jgi:hypothetical protein
MGDFSVESEDGLQFEQHYSVEMHSFAKRPHENLIKIRKAGENAESAQQQHLQLQVV